MSSPPQVAPLSKTSSRSTLFGQFTGLISGRTTPGGAAAMSTASTATRTPGDSYTVEIPAASPARRLDSSSRASRRFRRRDPNRLIIDVAARETMPMSSADEDDENEQPEGRRRRRSIGAEALATPQVRSIRLIGNSNPRYQWEQYFKTKEELAKMRKPLRRYYERNNYLISQYLYIDRLLDSSMPHELLQEYSNPHIPPTIHENGANVEHSKDKKSPPRIKRTPKNIYTLPNEGTPLLPAVTDEDPATTAQRERDLEAYLEGENDIDSSSRVVSIAIAVNAAANTLLLAAKIAVTAMTSSLSVLASLVDAALDFLSTAIVYATARLVARRDGALYPVGRRPLEPLGVLVFAVVMMTAFTQVGVACLQRLAEAPPHSVIALDKASVAIMLSTVLVKGICWIWCRSVRNTSVQALAQDAATDVLFNSASILFPIAGAALRAWWLDPLGGLLLAATVIALWARNAAGHLRRLSGRAAPRDTRAVLLYLTMRFARCVRAITALRAWHAGDGVLVEVDVELDPAMPLRDAHDVGESLQYVLESVPGVERAWVHLDYRAGNLSGHVARGEGE